jgi:hypothetical protein
MSSRKKIRQAPGRLLRQKLVISVRCVARVETLPLKGPRLLIRHWILYTEKSHTQTCLLRLPGGCLYPARHNRPSNQLNTIKYNINKKDDYVLYGRHTTRRTPTTNTQVQHYLNEQQPSLTSLRVIYCT